METMKFWWLRPRTLAEKGFFPEDWPNDCTHAAIVVAPTEDRGRAVAAQAGGDIWLDRGKAVCEEIRAEEFEVDCLVLDDALPDCPRCGYTWDEDEEAVKIFEE